jgi:hypothetical protein
MNKTLIIVASGLITALLIGWMIPGIIANPYNAMAMRGINNGMMTSGMNNGMMHGGMNGMHMAMNNGYTDCPMHNHQNSHMHQMMYNQSQMHIECQEMMQNMHMQHQSHNQENHSYTEG